MENCLVTKLKGIVDNDMLVHLGNAQGEIPTSNALVLRATDSTKPITVTIKSDNVFTDATHTEDLGKTATVITTNADTILRFKGDSDTVTVEFGLKTDVYGIGGGFVLDKNSYGFDNLYRLNSYIELKTDDIPKLFPNIGIMLLNFSEAHLSGNIAELVPCDKLISVNLGTDNVGTEGVIGTLESLLIGKYNRATSVQKQNNGFLSVTSPSVTFNGVTHDGEMYAAYAATSPYITVKLGGASGTLLGTWDGTSWTYAE